MISIDSIDKYFNFAQGNQQLATCAKRGKLV